MGVPPAQLLSWGSDVARDFVRRKEDLSVGIAKIAEREELNQHQIQRVIEEANHSTLEMLRKAGQQNPHFKLASTDDVIARLTKPIAKTAEAILAPLTNAAYVKGGMFKKASAGRTSTVRRSDVLRDYEHLIGRIGILRKNAELNFELAVSETEQAVDHLGRLVDQHAAIDKKSVSELAKVASAHDPKNAEAWTDFFGAVRRWLVQDYTKIGHPVPLNLVDDKLEMPGSPVRVINGKSSLCVALDTLSGKVDKEDRALGVLYSVANFGDAVVKSFKSFRDNKDFAEAIDQAMLDPSVVKAASAVSAGDGALLDYILVKAAADMPEGDDKPNVDKKDTGDKPLRRRGLLGRTVGLGAHVAKKLLPFAAVTALLGAGGVAAGTAAGGLTKKEDFETAGKSSREDRS
jgi:hypothetical protein